MPIINFDSLEQVPEGLKEFAKTDDATGKVTKSTWSPSSKLDEFREKQHQSLQASWSSLSLARALQEPDRGQPGRVRCRTERTPRREQARQGRRTQDHDRDRAGHSGSRQGDPRRLRGQRKSLRRELTDMQNKATTLTERLNRTRIDKDVTAAVIAPDSGVRPEALPDVLERAYGLFKVEDDQIVPKRGEQRDLRRRWREPHDRGRVAGQAPRRGPALLQGQQRWRCRRWQGREDRRLHAGTDRPDVAPSKLALANKTGAGRTVRLPPSKLSSVSTRSPRLSAVCRG
jgi:hypothetical protein